MRVGHPGFDWTAMDAAGATRVHYLTTFMEEREAETRDAKLRAYAEGLQEAVSIMVSVNCQARRRRRNPPHPTR